MQENVKQLISQAKNICLIPSLHEPESFTSCLALFYTLRQLNKNVNVISKTPPHYLSFLVPGVDFLSSPKNFVISIPRLLADISQIYYEKTDENLRIHLTTDSGNLRKEDIAFYFQEAKPDLVITLGIADFKKELEHNLDSFGFVMGVPIINIDNQKNNTQFGQANIIQETSLSQITREFISSISEQTIDKHAATCLLAGIIIYYDNFKSPQLKAEIFEIAGQLLKQGADHAAIASHLFTASPKELDFIDAVSKNLRTHEHLSLAILPSSEFEDVAFMQSPALGEKMGSLGNAAHLLVLWQSHNSEPVVRGLFYSKDSNATAHVESALTSQRAGKCLLLTMKEESLESAPQKILELIR